MVDDGNLQHWNYYLLHEPSSNSKLNVFATTVVSLHSLYCAVFKKSDYKIKFYVYFFPRCLLGHGPFAQIFLNSASSSIMVLSIKNVHRVYYTMQMDI